MKTLLHPVYFPNIITFSIIANHDITWEVEDNFQKQTYRNRSYICGDRGKLMLNLPIKHVGTKKGRQKYKDVKIDSSENWQRQHWRTLETAYRTSPFFEYYEDDIAPLFKEKSGFLLDFNLKSIEIVCSCLQLEMSENKTNSYSIALEDIHDQRILVDAKKKNPVALEHYTQVFGDRHGFIENVSILDLLFNEGPNSISYLKKVSESLSAKTQN